MSSLPVHRRLVVSRAVALLLVLALAVVALPSLAAAQTTVSTPRGQSLMWRNGSAHTTAGANSALTIEQGMIAFVDDCPTGFNDIVYPQADIYVVPAGSVSDGSTLSDVSGTPNTTAPGSRLFILETIGYTAPSGPIGTGQYAVVYDECQNGKFEAGTDAAFDPAVTVTIPADVPPLPAIDGLKARAAEEAAYWAQATHDYLVFLTAAEIGGIISSRWLTTIPYFLSQVAGTYLPDVRHAAIQLLINNARRWQGIAADPPDPEFAQPTVLTGRPQLATEADVPLGGELLDLAQAVADEEALAQALLHSMERYQGADLEDDGDWALVHARAVRDTSRLLAAQLERTDVAIDTLEAAIAGDSRDLDAILDEVTTLRARIVADGFTADERREAAALGISSDELAAFRDELADQEDTETTEAGFLATLADLRDAHLATAPELETFAADMEPVITLLGDDPGVTDPAPRPHAGGPYGGSEGNALTFDASATTSDSTITEFAWDLDGDGHFDDATGPTPTHTYEAPRDGLVGVRVTNAAGWQDVAYAAVTIAEANAPAEITGASPVDRLVDVTVGQGQDFSVTASDPEGQPVTVTWEVDDDPAGSGATFSYTPTTDDVGAHRVRAVADDGHPIGGRARRQWMVLVTMPDADGDGWPSDLDCDDDDAQVHPDRHEVVGNGKDDDCDPETSDAGTPPAAAFTVSADQAPVGEELAFHDDSSDADGDIASWAWDFGDGTSASEPDPRHAYAAPGRYTVTLTVTDGQGDTATATRQVRATAAPQADFTVTPAVPELDTEVTFTDTSGDADGEVVAWAWDFGDGTTSDERHPTHTFATPGSYPVALTVTDDDGFTDRATRTVRVTAPSAAGFGVAKGRNPASLHEGATVVAVSSVRSPVTSYAGEKAIDADASSMWATPAGEEADQRLRVRLAGGGGVVDRVTIAGSSGSDGIRGFALRVSQTGDDDDFTTVATGEVPRDNTGATFSFSPVRARYAELVATSNHGGSAVMVRMFALATRDREGGIVSATEGVRATVVDASSEQANGPAANLLDGSQQYWRTSAGSPTGQWATVAVGGKGRFTVDRVTITPNGSTDSPREVDVLVSSTTTDSDAFSLVRTATLTQGTTPQIIAFAPIEARYVRFRVQSNFGNASYTTVREVGVLAPDGANVADGKGVGADVVGVTSAAAGLGPETVLDYSTNGMWRTENGKASDQSFTVRLLDGGPWLVDRVDVQVPTGAAAARRVAVQVSTTTPTDDAFTTVAEATLPNDNRARPLTFPAVAARYVRLVAIDNHGASYTEVRDVRVWSPQLGDETVPFDDASADADGEIVGWSWDFGDGTTSTQQHPVHTYAAPGTYTVTLTVTDDDGLESTATMDYTVGRRPTPDYDWSPSPALEGSIIRFTDRTDTPGSTVAWRWTMPNVGPKTVASATHVFLDDGAYPTTLTVTDHQYLTATAQRTVTVDNKPPVVNAGNDLQVLWGQRLPLMSTVSDVAADSIECHWDFGNGDTRTVSPCDNAKARVDYAYPHPGTYSATLTVTDEDGGATSDAITVTAAKRPTHAHLVQVRSGAGGAVSVEGRLLDGVHLGRVPDRDVDLRYGDTTTSRRTDAAGQAQAEFAFQAGVEEAAMAFAGDSHYLATETAKPLDPALGDIVFIIDNSGSMGGSIDAVKANISTMARQLSAELDFRLGVVTFGGSEAGGRGVTRQPLTDDLGDAHGALDGITLSGGFEPGYQAIVHALGEDTGFRTNAGTCAVLVGDESPQTSTTVPETKEDAHAALVARGATLFAIVGTDPASKAGYGGDPGSLTDLTGGAAFSIGSFRSNPQPVLEALFDRCIDTITAPDLGVAKTVDRDEARAGDALEYTITVDNASTGPASGVTLTDTLPPGVELVAASDGGTVDGGTVTWPTFSLGANAQTTRTVAARIADGALPGDLVNRVEVTDDGSGGADRDPGDNAAEATTTVLPPLVAPTVDAGADRAVVVGDTVDLAATFVDPDSDGWTATVDWGDGAHGPGTVDGGARRVSGAHRYLAAGTYALTVCVTDDDGQMACDTAEVVVTTGNLPPVLDPVADARLDEGTQQAILLRATDPDGDAVTIAVDGLPAFADQTDHGDGTATVVVAPGYDDAGTYPLAVTASDGTADDTATFTVTVDDVPAPVATDAEVATDEDSPLDLTLAAAGTTTSFRIESAPEHGTLLGTAPDLRYVPDADWHGTDTLTFTAANTGARSNVATVRIAVRPVNDPPVLAPVTDQQLAVGDERPVGLSASDVDGDPLAFSVPHGPGFATLLDAGDGTATLWLRPDATHVGSHSVRIAVSDGAAHTTAAMTVTVETGNSPPVADAGGPYEVAEGAELTVSAAGSSDPDGPLAAYAWDLDDDGEFDDATGRDATVSYPDDATETIAVQVTDGEGLTAEATTTVTVTNASPIITGFAGQPGLAGGAAWGGTFAAGFTDPGTADTHSARFSLPGGDRFVAPYTSGQAVDTRFATTGCGLRVGVEVTDDDGGRDDATTTIDVGHGSFMPPLRDDGQAHAATSGQVVPVKVRITDCNGKDRRDLAPAIRVRAGDGVSGTMTGPELIPDTVADSQDHGVMRRNGNHYHYNLDADFGQGEWTILVYPYGAGDGGATLRHRLHILG